MGFAPECGRTNPQVASDASKRIGSAGLQPPSTFRGSADIATIDAVYAPGASPETSHDGAVPIVVCCSSPIAKTRHWYAAAPSTVGHAIASPDAASAGAGGASEVCPSIVATVRTTWPSPVAASSYVPGRGATSARQRTRTEPAPGAA
jgi:hypothetical protein